MVCFLGIFSLKRQPTVMDIRSSVDLELRPDQSRKLLCKCSSRDCEIFYPGSCAPAVDVGEKCSDRRFIKSNIVCTDFSDTSMVCF